MKLKHILRSSYTVILLLFLSGCGKHIINLNSVEIPAATAPDQVARSKVAIMPITGKIVTEKNIGLLKKGLKGFMKHTTESDNIMKYEQVELSLSKNPELFNAYKAILEDVVDFDQFLVANKKDKKFQVDPYLNYNNILELHPKKKSKKKKKDKESGSDIHINWIINIKEEIGKQYASSSSAKKLSKELNCDYLLIPVIQEKYLHESEIHLCFFLPFLYTSRLNTSNNIALYLVDGQSGQIVKASIGMNYSPLFVAASLQRILEKGSFAGTISLKKIEPKSGSCLGLTK